MNAENIHLDEARAPADRPRISEGCLRSERSRAARGTYREILIALAAVAPRALEAPPSKIIAAAEILRRHVMPGSGADRALTLALACRERRTFERFLRRNPRFIAEILREVGP
jgi:hypothetical protein